MKFGVLILLALVVVVAAVVLRFILKQIAINKPGGAFLRVSVVRDSTTA